MAAMQTSASKLPHTAGAGLQAESTQGRMDLGKSSSLVIPRFPHHQSRIIHSFIHSFIPSLPEPTVCHTEPEMPEGPTSSQDYSTPFHSVPQRRRV